MLYLAADHRGFQLKEAIKKYLIENNIEAEDRGAFSYNQDDDYTDFAITACEKIIENPSFHKGIFLCGSGHGMDMVANKYKGLRAAFCFNRQVAAQSREHEDANILVLAADWTDEAQAIDIIVTWLGKQFSGGERHMRRLKKIEEIENRNFK